MASTGSPGKASGTRLLLRLSDLPAKVTADDIENYFYTREPDLEEVKVNELREGRAVVEVVGLKDPGEFTRQKHRLGRDNKFKVELQVQDNVEQTSSKTQEEVTLTPSKTIEITVVSGSDIGADMIQVYLEGPASGGGEKEVEVMTRVSNGVYRAKLSSIEEAQIIVNKRHHVFTGTELKIGYAQGSHPSSAGHSPRLPPSSATHSTGGSAPTASLPPTVPPSSSATHSIGGGAPTASLPPTVPPSLATHSIGGSAATTASLPTTAASLPLNPPAVSTASISGHSPGASEAGQPDTTSIREIEEAQTNSELTSQLYHNDRLMIDSMPSDWNDEALGMEIEDFLGISDEDYKVKSLDNGYLLVLSKHYTEQELLDTIESLSAKDISAARCEISRAVCVAGISNDKFLNVAALKLYFGNKKRSGGGDVELVKLLEESGMVQITFKEHQVALAVAERKHPKLGPNVEITVVDPLGNSDGSKLSETVPSSQVFVSGITEVELKNEQSLREYFGNAHESGGGEIETLEFDGCNKASISFKDPSVVSTVLAKGHPKLGLSARVSHADSGEQKPQHKKSDLVVVPQDPLIFQLDKLVASYLRSNPELVASAVSQSSVRAKVDDNSDNIVVFPTSSSPPDWRKICQEILTVVTEEKAAKATLAIPKEASGEVLPIIMKESQENGLKYDFVENKTSVLVVGEASAVASLQATVKEVNASFVTRKENIAFDSDAACVFFEECRIAEMSSLYPKLQITLNRTKQALAVFGCIRDLTVFKEEFPRICDHVLFPCQFQPLELQLLSQLTHQEIVQETHEVVPYFQKSSTSAYPEFFSLLSSPQQAGTAETIATSIRDRIQMDARSLPRSFKLKDVNNASFLVLLQELKQTHTFVHEVEEGKLIVAGMRNSVSTVSQALIEFIKERCTVTREVDLKRAFLQLLSFDTKMNSKWIDCLAEIGKNVQILKQPKQSSKKPSLGLKGEPHLIEEADERIKALQSSVCQKSLPIVRPGIAKFFKHSQNRKMLYGIQAQAKVSIEIGTEEQDADEKKPSLTSSKFVKVCSGSTRQLKTVNVYVGDITEFNRAEVIVNAANDQLQHIGGVALSIARKGGPVIQEESDEHVRRRGTVETGKAVLFTKTGNLPPPYKAIVHAVGPKWNHSSATHDRDIALLKKACMRALVCAKSYGSISIPAISSGVFGFPTDVCADTLIQAVVEFSEMHEDSELTDINFIILQNNASAFQSAMRKHIRNVASYQSSGVGSSSSPLSSSSSSSFSSASHSVHTGITETQQPTRTRRRTSSAKPSAPSYQPTALQMIKITQGSILDVQVDVLVNTTDPNLGFGGFVAKALLKAAGDTLKDECASKAPVPVGGVAVTGAGNMNCKHVIHAVLPNYDGPGGQSEKVLCSVVRKCLKECTGRKLQSIAIPSIGAGNLSYPDDVVARCLLNETASYLDKNKGKTTLQTVNFVIFMPRTYQVFQQYFKSLTSSSASAVASVTPRVFSGKESASSESLSSSATSYTAMDSRSFALTPTLQLVILQGDVSDDDSHVIVNTTNGQLNLAGAGAVSSAIFRKGGSALQQICDSIVASQGQLREGNVVITTGTGNLKCREVFHVVFNSGHEGRFVETIFTCLNKAEERKRQSIAFPAIGTGVSGYPTAKAAKGMVKALHKFISKKPGYLKMIRVVLFQQQMYQEFAEAFSSMKEEGGENWFTSAWRTVGSLFSGHSSKEENGMKEIAEEPAASAVDKIEEEEECEDPSDCFGSDVSSELNEVVISIFGRTNDALRLAEKLIQEIVKDQFIHEVMLDKEISKLTHDQVKALEKEASLKNVEIEIDCDPALHQIKLHACRADVLYMKDKVREAVYKVREALAKLEQEKVMLSAAKTVHQHIHWVRQLSDGDDEYNEVHNYEIEQAYQQKQSGYKCNKGGEEFIIDFKTMQETDLVSKDVVKVKRVDLAEVEKPADWNPMPTDPQTGNEVHVHLVTLKPGSTEYNNIESQFKATMVTGRDFKQLISIERVQNPNLYGQYMIRKKQMDKHNPQGTTNELCLFHGTTADSCVKINTQGFNRSFKGKNGTVYGEGVYFAKDARYSNGYATPDASGHKRMYLTRVLTGEYTASSRGTLIPPPKNPQVNPNVLFDSTVDNVANPRIFVVYFDAQNYPAYLITYN